MADDGGRVYVYSPPACDRCGDRAAINLGAWGLGSWCLPCLQKAAGKQPLESKTITLRCPGCGGVYSAESQWTEMTDRDGAFAMTCQCPNPECGQYTTVTLEGDE